MSARGRALLVGVIASALTFLLAGGPRVASVWLLPSVFMLAEFTGGWLAVAASSTALVTALLLIASPVHPLMLTAACALLGARLLRTGLPNFLAVILLAGGALAAEMFAAGGMSAPPGPAAIAVELLRAGCNVALVRLLVSVRGLRRLCLPPLRRWRFEDALFLAGVAAFIPSLMLLDNAGSNAHPEVSWWLVAVLVVVQLSMAFAGALSVHVSRGLNARLREGRLRSARRRCSGLPSELAALFLGARHISDGLHRQNALLGLHLESAKLRTGRLQQQAEAIERQRRRLDLEYQRARSAADEVDSRWRAFLDVVPEALFITDQSGRITYANEGVRQLLGYEPGKLAGSLITTLATAANPGKDVLGLAASLTAGQPGAAPKERTVRFADSRGAQRELSARVSVFQTSEGKLLNVRLREATGPLQLARDHFVATMSHEIRTPLHGLLATLDMLRSEALSGEGSRRLGIARTSARTLMRIANDVLDLSRISVGGMSIERKPMSIDRLVNDVVDEARSREEALLLDIHVAAGSSTPSAVLGDPLRIKQVLRNLVSNALKFTAAGTVTVSAHWSAGICTIDVADTGAGVPANRRESIFEAFVQADRSSSRRHGGAGLGLAISRQLSEAMGGSLALLQSGPRGSTFRMTLPLPATDDVPLDEQSQRNLPAVKGRILVAEDDEASRYVAQTLLEVLECPARIVGNGNDALELLSSGEFDLALLDCEMPGLDGFEVTARVRQLGGRHIPIIAMTASTMSADRQRCFDAGMDDLLAKPFGKSALNDMLAKWLAPHPGNSAQAPLARELAVRPELDLSVFEELRQSLNWKVPQLRKIYSSVRESAQQTIDALGGGAPPDMELAQRRLHSLQGGAGLVGARQVEFAASRLFQALRANKTQELAEGLPQLVDALRRFDKVLDGRLGALSAR